MEILAISLACWQNQNQFDLEFSIVIKYAGAGAGELVAPVANWAQHYN